MKEIFVRPATNADASTADFDDVLPDKWRSGGNRRSFVAVGSAGGIMGHCRGVDNDFHPDSRVLVLEVADEDGLGTISRADVEDALVKEQIRVSTLPLRLKPSADDEEEVIAFCVRHGAVLVQLMPPWRYVVDDALRAWADQHRSTSDGISARRPRSASGPAMMELFIDHYIEQHATWSPAGTPDRLHAEFAEDFDPEVPGSADFERSAVLHRGDELVAQAIVWPEEDGGEREVTLQCRPYTRQSARSDMEACLAAVVERSADGDVLLIDSHVTEKVESAMMADIPQSLETSPGTWTAIVAIPVPHGPRPVAFPAHQIPDDASFARQFVVTKGGRAPLTRKFP